MKFRHSSANENLCGPILYVKIPMKTKTVRYDKIAFYLKAARLTFFKGSVSFVGVLCGSRIVCRCDA